MQLFRAPLQDLRCALCHDRLEAALAQACGACGTLLHRDCAGEVEGCLTLGCEGVQQTFAEFMQARDGPWVRWGMLCGAILGSIIGLAFPWHGIGAEVSVLWQLIATVLRGALTGVILGPAVGFAVRAWLEERAPAAHRPCPECAGPLVLEGTYCKACGYERS